MRLNIFGKRVSLKLQKGLSREFGMEGYFHPGKSQIVLDGDLKGQEMMQTLLHEVCHAVIHRTGVSQAISNELNEVISENMANALVENFTIQLKKK